MMDLAEIRKKAKARTQTPNAAVKAPAASAERPQRSSKSIQGRPPERETDSALPSMISLPPQQAGSEDPLEALFNFRPDIALATEESYLQTLRAQDEERREELCEWLTFSLGSEDYALDIGGVGEIIKPREITDIPRVPDFILGVISLRGIIIPVFDLKRRLKLGVGEISASSRIVVCQSGERSAGLLVDSITQVVRIPIGAVEPPPSVLTGLDRELVEGVGRFQGRMLIQLDLASVLNAELI